MRWGQRTLQLRLDQRRWNIFGRSDVETTAKFAVAHAVKEIDEKTNSQPDHEASPRFQRETQHQNKTKKNAEKREQWDQWHAERTATICVFAA